MPRSPTAILEDAVRVVEGMMHHSSREANMCAHDDAPACCNTTRYFGVCDKMLVGLAILAMVRASPALAGEPVSPTVSAAKPDFNAAREFASTSAASTSAFMLPLPSSYHRVPSSYQAAGPSEFKAFSAA